MASIVSKTCMWLSRRAMSLRTGSLVRSLVSKAMWTLSAKLVVQITQLSTFIIAARTLASAEFGLFAYVATLVMPLVILAEGGWSEFVMKTNHEGNRLDQIATVALISGTAAMVAGLCVAALLGLYLELPHEALLVALFSFWLLMTPFSSVCEGLFIANALLRELSIIKIVAEVCGMAVAILALLHGWNVFSLVAARLASQIVSVVSYICVSKWLPKLVVSAVFIQELLDFSRYIIANRLLFFIRSYSGTIVVGSFLGLSEAGYYRAAERIVSAFSEVVGEPARQMAWSVLRRAAVSNPCQQGISPEVGAKATTFVVILLIISAPIYIGLALMSGTLIHFALGDGWAPAAILVSLLSIKQILLVPGYVTEPLLSLTGTIRKLSSVILINSLVSVGLILAFSPFGMVATAMAQCVAAVFSFTLSARLQSYYGAVNWLRILRGCVQPAIALVAMSLTVFLLGNVAAQSLSSGLTTNVLQMLAGGLVYVATLAVLHKLAGGFLPVVVADPGTKR